MYEDDRWLRRRRGGGVLLLLFLIAALAWPLWHWRGLGHPLAGETSVDVCARLSPIPALSGLHAQKVPAAGSAGACRWSEGEGDGIGSDKGPVHLQAMLSTTRSNGGQDLDRLFDNWRSEAKAVYGSAAGMRESGQENARVLSYSALDVRYRLVEDHGVLLLLTSGTLDDSAFDALIDPVRAALRTDPGKAR